MTLYSNRQLPILPGRLQPSTFGVYVLNYCVRNGNRWIHIAIITGLRTYPRGITDWLIRPMRKRPVKQGLRANAEQLTLTAILL